MEKRFEEYLLKYVDATTDSEREAIRKTLWREFGVKKAVFVMDMSGFSLLTQKYGVVHYLSMVKRMERTTLPIIEKNQGTVVKFEADNCFAMFDSVLPAVEAAVELNRTFAAMNLHTEESFDIRVSVGIDYGDVLLIGGPDFFGDTVNCACKLGEDIAGPGEIYISETAFRRIPKNSGIHGKKMRLSISGIRLNAVCLEYQ